MAWMKIHFAGWLREFVLRKPSSRRMRWMRGAASPISPSNIKAAYPSNYVLSWAIAFMAVMTVS